MSANLYRVCDESNTLLYIGISFSALRRIATHAQKARWFDRVAIIDVQTFESRSEARKAERLAIFNEKPVFNVQDRDRAPPKERRTQYSPDLPLLNAATVARCNNAWAARSGRIID